MTTSTSSVRTYLVVYALLLVGLGATVAVSYLPHSSASLLAALAIAFAKATLVVLFFMHVRDSPRLVGLAAAAGLVWLAILLALVIADYSTRGWIPTRIPASLSIPSGNEPFEDDRPAQ